MTSSCCQASLRLLSLLKHVNVIRTKLGGKQEYHVMHCYHVSMCLSAVLNPTLLHRTTPATSVCVWLLHYRPPWHQQESSSLPFLHKWIPNSTSADVNLRYSLTWLKICVKVRVMLCSQWCLCGSLLQRCFCYAVKVAVGHPSEIDEIFDAISYSKGASVIRMLHNYIGDAVSSLRDDYRPLWAVFTEACAFNTL